MAAGVPTPVAANSRTHLVLFPFPAKGHLAGFLAFADTVLRQYPDTAITVVTTARNALSIEAALHSSTPIRLHSLPFVPSDHGLPPAAESTADLQPYQFPLLYRAYDTLADALDSYLSTLASDPPCFISDIILPWSVDVAHRHGPFAACFLTCGAYGSALFALVWIHCPWTLTAGDVLSFPGHPGVVIHRSQLPSECGDDSWTDFHRKRVEVTRRADALLLNTVEEFEAVGLEMLRRELRVPVCPLGPLTSTPTPQEEDERIMSWLDAKDDASVLYIAFGSMFRLQEDDMRELAAGVAASGRRFIWAIRPPVGAGDDAAGEVSWLPCEGYEEMTEGLLVRGWAPQLPILAHRATGAFLSHCGWNSVLESMRHGVPIIGWPLAAEQSFNAKMLVEQWGVCVEVARGHGRDGFRVDRATVASAIEAVMGSGGKAVEMRRRVGEVRRLMESGWSHDGGAGSSATALEEFFLAAGAAPVKHNILRSF